MQVLRRRIIEHANAADALNDLCDGLLGTPAFAAGVEEVAPRNVPEPSRKLLVHHSHMTRVLGDYYAKPVEVQVQEYRLQQDQYSRRITLRPQASGRIVELGIVRMDLRLIPRDVADEIQERKSPLGAILIRHKVLRRIEPRWYVKFGPQESALAHFKFKLPGEVFGRIGTIFCNEEPAIELLEIVTDPADPGKL